MTTEIPTRNPSVVAFETEDGCWRLRHKIDAYFRSEAVSTASWPTKDAALAAVLPEQSPSTWYRWPITETPFAENK